jgi:hypothetical protein
LLKEFPKVWKSFQEFGKECKSAGPLGPWVRRLVKMAIATAAQSAMNTGLPAGYDRPEEAGMGRRQPLNPAMVGLLHFR